MSDITLPVHPRTGLQAIGFGKRGPIWPIAGGAPEEGEEREGGDEQGEITPPSANEWWRFESKEAAEEWAKNLVTKRLTRERKTKLDPLQQKHDMLEAEVERLKGLADKSQTDDERDAANAAAVSQELEALRSYKASRERQELIAEVANDAGLDPKFHKFITTDGDADAIEAQAKELLDALSESGANTKRTPAPKAPKEESSDEAPAGGNGSGGGGGSGDESDEALIAEILEASKNRQFGTVHY